MTMFSPEWRSPVCERPKATIALRLVPFTAIPLQVLAQGGGNPPIAGSKTFPSGSATIAKSF
jgi:hypothetical protein